MKKEKSCGAIIYKMVNDQFYIFLVKHNTGHWSFPKGHVEQNESEEQTALREVKEETNLDIIIDNHFRRVHTYSPKKDVMKDVVLFLATVKDKSEKEKRQEKEIQELNWFLWKDALKIITYQKDKDLLKQAIEYLSNK